MNTSIREIEKAASITHQHIAAVINTFLDKSSPDNKPTNVKILDFGCGDGKLLAHILDSLPLLQPNVIFDVNGLDVIDAGQQDAGFIDETIKFLRVKHPHFE